PTVGLSLNVRLTAVSETGDFIGLDNGLFVFASHLRAVDQSPPADFVAVAEQFVGAPYLWGGRQWTGIDCSGLVQAALNAVGLAAPRDSDMQETGLGHAIDAHGFDDPRRGDLVFWPGHVGILTDADTLLHATGYRMQVVIEPFAEAVERIRAAGPDIRSIRRL
ncbi:MAG: NlpC/P60 family protein, partial [Bosea sp. (in: a-proteobacteria)]|nr:NlpC/P60 family protein [Bosea sp. (in: a-proteobacteria)]